MFDKSNILAIKNILLLLTLVACETSAQTLLNSSIPGKGHYIKFLSENQSLIMGMIFYAIVGFVYSRVLYSLRKNSKSLKSSKSYEKTKSPKFPKFEDISK